jgi:hypothetical protein
MLIYFIQSPMWTFYENLGKISESACISAVANCRGPIFGNGAGVGSNIVILQFKPWPSLLWPLCENLVEIVCGISLNIGKGPVLGAGRGPQMC